MCSFKHCKNNINERENEFNSLLECVMSKIHNQVRKIVENNPKTTISILVAKFDISCHLTLIGKI